jgi:ribosomal protein L3 glutamine methyltransferase
MPKKAKAKKAPARLPRPGELVTVLDFVRYAATAFNRAKLAYAQGTDDAVGDAVLLVCGALDLAPQDFDAFAAARVTAEERGRLFDLIEARVRTRMPVAYLIKRVYQRGVPFYVDQRVIVPRSYVGEILDGELFDGGELSLVGDPNAVERVLDLCTGSGCLAILAAMRFPNAKVDAVDVSSDALAVAAINVAEHGLDDRVTLHRGDLYAPVAAMRYDVIITNPPYVDAHGMASLPPECRHEPEHALDGGADGTVIVRRILGGVAAHLTTGGGILCEVGRGRAMLEHNFPHTSFLWIDTEASAGEVFWLTADALFVGA